MALTATVHSFEIALSDVDRGVYETLDLRVAQHPSETIPRMLVRTLAFCLAHDDGIAFSKGGLSANDEPPVAVRDGTGRLLHWIDVGAPSAERLHKAAKLARVSIYTHEEPQLLRGVEGKTIHKAAEIEVHAIDPGFVDELAAKVERRTKLELTRTDGTLYVTVAGSTIEASLRTRPLHQG